MAKRGRPAQGKNSTKRLVKVPAGGDNVRTSGITPRVNNNRPRKTT